MEYRGVKYAVVQGVRPNVWRWTVLVGRPEMLRRGEAETEHRADMEARAVIDRALALEEMFRSRNDD
jgi:hypothetical protein